MAAESAAITSKLNRLVTRRNFFCGSAGLGLLGLGVLHLKFRPSLIEHVTARQLVQRHLEDWKEKMEQELESSIEPLSACFERAASGVDEFSTAALGFWTKYYWMIDALPWTGTGRQQEWLRAEFERLVLSEEDLAKSLERVVANHLGALRDTEDNMLVALRADWAQSSEAETWTLGTAEEFRSRVDQACRLASSAAQEDLLGDIACMATSQVTAVVLNKIVARILTRLGSSATILVLGTAGGSVSLGLTLLAGLMIDGILSWLWNWWDDPHGQLANQLQDFLAQMEDELCNGREGCGGLREQLLLISKTRREQMESALLSLVGDA